MSEGTCSDQQERADVADIPQPAQADTPKSTSAKPTRRKPRSQSERLIGVKDPEPELTEQPVAPRTVTFLIEGEWDAATEPVGYELAAELAGGAE